MGLWNQGNNFEKTLGIAELTNLLTTSLVFSLHIKKSFDYTRSAQENPVPVERSEWRRFVRGEVVGLTNSLSYCRP